MSISSVTSKVVYVGTATTTTHAYPFIIFAAADLEVTDWTTASGSSSVLTLDTDYLVSGVALAAGGNVILSGSYTATNLPTGHQLIIRRKVDLTQEVDYVENDPFPAATHERALDRLTMISQQQQEQINRAVQSDITTTSSAVVYIDADASASSAVVAVDAQVASASSAVVSIAQASNSVVSATQATTSAVECASSATVAVAQAVLASSYAGVFTTANPTFTGTTNVVTLIGTLISSATSYVTGTANATTLAATLVTATTGNVSGTLNATTLAATLVTATAINITGTVNATNIKGDGSLLTGLSYLTDVSQGDLNTTTGEVNVANTVPLAHVTLPGGTYGFWPQLKMSDTTNREWDARLIIDAAQAGWTTYVTTIALTPGTSESGLGLYAQQRYVTASGHDHWIFLLVDKVTKNIISSYQAPDHPSANQGGATEIDIPHPFGSYDPNKYEIVVVDNADLPAMRQKVTRQKSLLTIINEDYEIDDTKQPKYTPREIIKIDEYGDIEGGVIKTLKTPEWAKLMIGVPDLTLKRRVVEKLPNNILFKKLRSK